MAAGVAILGSTGSVGRNALEVLRHLGAGFRVVSLAANSNGDRLIEQIREFRPRVAVLSDPVAAAAISAEAERLGTHLLSGPDALLELVRDADVSCVVGAIVGIAGLASSLETVRLGKRLALANKESLVVAGDLIMRTALETGAKVLPVDSEHSAIFQCLQSGQRGEVRRLLLTASGGPFRTWSREDIDRATLDEALQHPTWRMGGKITVDSATMMNKALEVIEAHWLFGVPPERIDVVVHPESIVHSMVEFVDGSVVAQMSPPDMRLPLQHALTWPSRVDGCVSPLDWRSAMRLSFEPPDPVRFPAVALGRRALEIGGVAGAVLNGANEAAVSQFMSGRIPFGDISRLVTQALAAHPIHHSPSLADLIAADAWGREFVLRSCGV